MQLLLTGNHLTSSLLISLTIILITPHNHLPPYGYSQSH